MGLVIGVELEADDGVAVEGFGEAAQGFGAGAVSAALDPGDHRLGGTHALGELLLGEAELCSTHDRHAGDLLEGAEAILRLAVLGAAGAPLGDVLFDAVAARAVLLGNSAHLTALVSSSANHRVRGRHVWLAERDASDAVAERRLFASQVNVCTLRDERTIEVATSALGSMPTTRVPEKR